MYQVKKRSLPISTCFIVGEKKERSNVGELSSYLIDLISFFVEDDVMGLYIACP